MNTNYLQEFLPDLAEFKEKTMKFAAKEITIPEYKGFSGGFGSYAQRGGDKHMLRLRMAGGRVTKTRLKFVAEAIAKYHIDLLKLTTCETIQFHNLSAADLCDIIEPAWKADMITRGGGGDFPRNVMATPLTGVTTDEYFDVTHCAEVASSFLMRYIRGPKFPRKLKVCFSSNEDNEVHATFRDMGFVARPDKTFDLYIAGGLGNNPKLGVKVAKQIDPSQILYYIDAMVRTFIKNGNYENRGKARTRYMQESLGVEGLKKEYLKHLAESKRGEDLTIEVYEYFIDKTGDKKAPDDKRVIPQKQKGLYSVLYQPIGGTVAPDKMIALYEAVKDMDEVELRITPNDSMYIINLNGDEAATILKLTDDSAVTAFDKSVSCIGASICQVGLADSQTMLSECVERVRKENFADGVLPSVHFSGCPSSCGTHQTAPIGFRGAMKQTVDGPVPAFAIFVGGCAKQGKEVISETALGRAIARTDIPEFLVELGHMVADDHATYDTWIGTHGDDLENLIAKYTA